MWSKFRQGSNASCFEAGIRTTTYPFRCFYTIIINNELLPEVKVIYNTYIGLSTHTCITNHAALLCSCKTLSNGVYLHGDMSITIYQCIILIHCIMLFLCPNTPYTCALYALPLTMYFFMGFLVFTAVHILIEAMQC